MQRALIVDDSKTAQFRLKKMLVRYDLIVDTALSAEEALGYLSYRAPAVIFLDHHMEGMDGLEALRIIKANPNTAMIPVIMYTAQKGDLYIGQARALGALDILSKETFKPSNLERVLAGLGIRPSENSAESTSPPSETAKVPAAPAQIETPKPRQVKAAKPKGASAVPSSDDPPLIQIRAQVARLFEIHIADVRQQITENTRFIVRRLSGEIEKKALNEPTVGDVPLSVVNAEMSADQRKASLVSGSLLVLIIMGLGLLGYELFQTKGELNQLADSYSALVDLNRQNISLMTEISEKIAPQTAEQSPPAGLDHNLMDALSWALDTDLQFGFNTPPLGEGQINKISNLVYRLASAGFNGVIELNIHFGNVCLQQEATGGWQLADSNTTIDKCTFLEELNPEFSAGDYLSMAYLNFEQTAAPLQGGDIEMYVSSSGLSSPRYEYPVAEAGITAGEWNHIALQNNRVAISFTYL